jgi:hypothetical protein
VFFPHLGDLHVDNVEDRDGVVLITARARVADAVCHQSRIRE